MIKEKKLTYSIIKNDNNSKVKDSKEISFKIKEREEQGMYIIHRALIKQLSSYRHGNACTKTRSQVKGGGKKPWKQKGTGRARAGSIRSPLWKGGGVIFGPKTRKYIKKINKKEKQLALRTLIYNKFKNTIVTENFINDLKKPNTKSIIERLYSFGISNKKRNNILIIVDKKNTNLYLSIRNLKNVELITADHLNIISLMRANKLIITGKGLNKINEIYNK